jgi:hypothetical protein
MRPGCECHRVGYSNWWLLIEQEARMADIATCAGLNKPALYLYFRNNGAIIGS